ncbi:MAG: hypothetical protein HZA88_20755 [Verrucomicrobia bacterium]|nr:hypothetical protein [Verrucomicrobiota bacterium]
MISKLVSGGQTGADRAALDWAIEHNIPHGGWCPKGRRTEDGPIDGRSRPTQLIGLIGSATTTFGVQRGTALRFNLREQTLERFGRRGQGHGNVVRTGSVTPASFEGSIALAFER